MKLPSNTLAVVTGATAGLGRVFAQRLARRGHPLLLTARDTTRLDALAAELAREYGVGVRAHAADLARDEDLERFSALVEHEGDVGVLIHSAGFGTAGKIRTSNLDEQMRMVRLHVVATARLAHAVLPGMVSRGRGWVINISSIAGWLYGPGNANYCATKGYQRQFTQALDTELTGTGVYVQALCPGFTHTEFHQRAGMDKSTVPSLLWSTAEAVVDISLAAAERGKPLVVVPTLKDRVLLMLARMAPHFLVRRGRPMSRRGPRSEEEKRG